MIRNFLKNQISLSENEEIEDIIHHHWLTFMPTLVKILILPVSILVLTFFISFNSLWVLLDSPFLAYATLTVFLIWATFSFYHWYIWYFDLVILTNKRIVIMEQKSMFEKIIIEARLEKIQDMTINIKGVLPVLFKFGSIKVQTASEENNIILKKIPYPQEVQKNILRLKENKNEAKQVDK